MLEKETMIEVTNRFGGSIGYTVPDLGINRHYEPNETKSISYDELLKLSYSIGGKNLIKDYMIVHNKEAVAALLGEVEPEYFYTETEVTKLLLEGSLAQLEDCLDFADKGVIDLVTKLAVDLKINDIAKRQIIFEKTGFDVNKAVEFNELDKLDNGDTVVKSSRRAAPITVTETESKPVRKTTPPKYKVTSML